MIFIFLTFTSDGSMKDMRIERAVGVCKTVFSAFSYFCKKKKLTPTTAQEELRLPKHRWITEPPTMWESRHAVIVLEQEKDITKVMSADRKHKHLIPSCQDIYVLESVHKALNPLVDFSDALSGEAYVSISCVKPALQLLNEEVLRHEDNDTELTKAIKTVTTYLNKEYNDAASDDLLNMATISTLASRPITSRLRKQRL